MKQYEDYIEDVLRREHEKNQTRAGDMRTLVTSDAGQALFEMIEGLISGYKDAHVFAETEAERMTHKGSILALSSLVAYINDLAANYVEPDNRGRIESEVPFQQSGFTVGAEFEG